MDDNLVIFGGHNFKRLASTIAEHCQVPLGRAITEPFPNGECHVRLIDDVRHKDVFVILSTCRIRHENPYSGTNDNLVELFIWGDTLKRASARRITAVIPFFGYARQDRKTTSRTPISARLVANLIERSGFDRVLTMDLHAGQIQGFFDIPLDHLTAGPVFAKKIEELNLPNPVFLSPDVGNMKKADKIRQALNKEVELAVIDKRRSIEGKVKSNHVIGEVEGNNVIMCDDIISTASTIKAGVELATTYGAKDFTIFASHGEFVSNALDNLNNPKIAAIYITDSVLPLFKYIETDKSETKKPDILNKIQILSIAPLFGEAITRIHRGDSISELLGKFG